MINIELPNSELVQLTADEIFEINLVPSLESKLNKVCVGLPFITSPISTVNAFQLVEQGVDPALQNTLSITVVHTSLSTWQKIESLYAQRGKHVVEYKPFAPNEIDHKTFCILLQKIKRQFIDGWPAKRIDGKLLSTTLTYTRSRFNL